MKSSEKEIVTAQRAGFTLVEILVAVAIIGILGTMAAVNIPRMLEESKIQATQSAVSTLKDAVVSYNLANHKYPADLKALVEASGDEEPIIDGGEGALEDPFGTEYKYERKGKKIVIISAGPDGEFGTEDDIRSDVVKKKKK